jgi:hypothetical protein
LAGAGDFQHSSLQSESWSRAFPPAKTLPAQTNRALNAGVVFKIDLSRFSPSGYSDSVKSQQPSGIVWR